MVTLASLFLWGDVMQAQSMIESYFVIVTKENPYGSYKALEKVYDDKEKANDVATEFRKDGKFEAIVCRLGLPYIYDSEQNKVDTMRRLI